MRELRRRRDFYTHIAIGTLKPDTFHRGFLLDLRTRTSHFKPVYKCGTCRAQMTAPPLKCNAFLGLSAKIREVMGGGEVDVEQVNDSPACKMADYFIFYTHNIL
jgi:hypothetical protein